MRETSEDYRRIVKSSTRHIGFHCALQGERSFTVSDILELNISRAISDGFQIGACGSDRLLLSVKATDRVEKGAKLTAFAYPEYQLNNTEPLGVYYADEVSTQDSVTTIIAYDKMNRNLDKVVLWTRSDAPAFPATQQDLLDYICTIKGITCKFTCQPFIVQEKPVGYTAREIIGFIAACHAANAHFNADGELIFKQFTQTNAKIERLRCYSHTVANDSGFTVNGVLFDLGGNTQLYIDGSASEYDEEAEGIVEVFCPFATIEVAEYVWHMIGGLTYYSCTLEMPAENLLEVGDVYTTTDAQGNTVQSIVLEQELSVSADDGYKETISAAAESDGNQRSTTNRIDDLESRISSGSSGGASAGTLAEYNVLSDMSVKYNGITYTVERAESGLISKISNDIGGEFSPTFSDGVTDIEMHNAAFLAVAMMCLNKSILIEPVIYVSFDGDMTNAGTDSNITVTFKGDTPIYADGYGGAKCLSATTHTLFAINGCGSYLNKDFTLLYRFKLNDTGLSPYYGLRRMIWCNYLGKHLAGMEIGFTGSADTSAVSTNKVNFEFTMHPSLYGQTNRADGEWHIAVVRRNGSSLSFWVDDEHLEGTFPSDTIQEPMYISGTNDIKTVDDFSSEGLSLNGYIQDLKLYDKALSDGEIAMALSAKT